MVPAAVVLLESLPVTGSGKLDSRALPAPDFGVADPAKPAESGAVAGASEAELAAVTAVVTRVLGLSDEPSPGQRFMALGGDSIAAIQVIAGLHREGYGYSVAKLLAAGTLADMARELEARQPEPAAAGTEPDGTRRGRRLAALGTERSAVLADRAASLGRSRWTCGTDPTQLGMVLPPRRAKPTEPTRPPPAGAWPQRMKPGCQMTSRSPAHWIRWPHAIPSWRAIFPADDLPAPLAILDRMRWTLQTGICGRSRIWPQRWGG
ncbi:hypothetical protein CIK84_18940 [Glutamicibacter arilaitensis]|uniref:Carrier domain-containing protein n=2 Tax=Glutamicibacter arilaitensis TaxID=256701 RepID=A0A2N7RX97_9MICC|nr:hypothetical protein CIK84_18940 [Glutamicibacter arilaitensis]